MKHKNNEQIYIFFIVVLSVLFAGLLIMVLSGWFYKADAPAKTLLMPGGSAVMELKGTQSSVLSYNFDGSYLAGETLKQNISIRNGGDEDIFIRAKLTIFTGDNEDPNLDLGTSQMWTKSDDGYYYFDGNVQSLNTVGFITGFKLSEDSQLASSSNYIVVITVEALSAEFDRNLVWGR